MWVPALVGVQVLGFRVWGSGFRVFSSQMGGPLRGFGISTKRDKETWHSFGIAKLSVLRIETCCEDHSILEYTMIYHTILESTTIYHTIP